MQGQRVHRNQNVDAICEEFGIMDIEDYFGVKALNHASNPSEETTDSVRKAKFQELNNAWEIYRNAKINDDKDEMRTAAKLIRRCEKALNISVATFEGLGINDNTDPLG